MRLPTNFTYLLALLAAGIIHDANDALAQANAKQAEASSTQNEARSSDRPAESHMVRTMPSTGIMNLRPSQPVDRPPIWSDVEQRLELLRRQRKELGASFNELEEYYGWLSNPKSTGSKTLAEHLPRLEEWQTAMPNSSSALIAAAKAYIDFAWEARGSGWAATVTPDGWQQFATRVGKAHGLIDRAIERGVKDGQAYALLAIIGYAEGLPREQVDAWLKAGRQLDPTYYSMYQNMATYLLPRWMGEKGDIEQFAGDIARKIGGDNGLEAFGRVAFSIQRYECGWGETLAHGQYDAELLAKSARVMLDRYPNSSRVANFAALCAMVTRDLPLAKRARPLVGSYNADDKIWLWENDHRHFMMWSSAAEDPKDEEHWAFTGLSGCPGIAFGNENRHVWCAQQFGATAAHLLDMRTGALVAAIPATGRVVNAFAYDPGREWLVYASWEDGGAASWSLWDLSGGRPPILHPTKEKCNAIAIHPKLPRIYWSEGQKVHCWDIAADQAGPDMDPPGHVHELLPSADGSLMAVNITRFAICDTATGAVKYELPPGEKNRPPKIHCRQVLAIDEEGRAWVIASDGAPQNQKHSLVRFAADGQTWETLIDDLGASRGCLSPDRKLLVTSGHIANGAAVCPIDVWNVESRRRVKRFGGHWNSIRQLVFSPDGKKLASVAQWADVVKTWSLEGLAD